MNLRLTSSMNTSLACVLLAGPFYLGGLLPGGSAAAAEFRAGAAQVCITPPLDTWINGGLGPGRARHIHDDLFVRALVLDDGATRLAFAVVDTCLLDRPVFDEAKRLVRQHTGLAPEAVMMSCTHTHSAGSACGAHLTEPDEAYRRWLPGRIADAVRCAFDNLAPAQLAWGRGSVPQHVFCRRRTEDPADYRAAVCTPSASGATCAKFGSQLNRHSSAHAPIVFRIRQ